MVGRPLPLLPGTRVELTSSRVTGTVIGTGVEQRREEATQVYLVELDTKHRGYIQNDAGQRRCFISVVVAHPSNVIVPTS